ncbi:DUF663-domain-containing protein [Neoconidiobolus thromboides FSU 785]|nr:DUF663-domain-containing protein [Neoconidiobolus thromboides FSU 785]
MGKGFHHRATTKQVNKKFKSKHSSKNALRDLAKGKVNAIKLAKGKLAGDLNKSDRKNQSKMQLKNKQLKLDELNQLFNGKLGITKLVAVVPLCEDVSSLDLIGKLFNSSKQQLPESFTSSVTLQSDILKHKLQFQILPRDLYTILDGVKVADFVIFVLSATKEVDQFGELCISSIQAQGIPNSFNFVEGLNQVPVKSQPDVKKSLSSFVNYFFPENDKVFNAENEMECLSVLRSIATQTPKLISFRENHPYLFADHVDYQVDNNNQEFGTLAVTGFVRGNNWDINRLVHLQDLGDFQIRAIETAVNPYLGEHTIQTQIANKMQLLPNPELQDSLINCNEPDLMEGEQTWPTEQELKEADERIEQLGLDTETKPRTKRVIKGTSSYQAAWIVESEGEEEDLEMDEEENEEENEDSEEEYEDIIEEDEQVEDNNNADLLTKEEDMEHYNEYLKQRENEFEGNKEFPDEVDTPLNTTARTRFQKYRGMLSIRSSPWDPYENLPMDYSRIFMIKDYLQTKRKVIKLANTIDESKVKAGSYVTIYIDKVPRSIEKMYNRNLPFILFGLLQHSNKITLLNYNVIRTTEYKEVIKSKDPILIQSGFRRYKIQPIFSQNAKKSKPLNNVYKMERFLPSGDSYNLSFYGPIQFSNDSCLLFKKDIQQNVQLVATGTFKDCDCNRIIVKRIILTGHPFKVNRKSAVVRFMFFNKEDIAWFKPVQLITKFGRLGHIKDSIGTHGHMKCVFNNPIKQHDTVCLYLYKRIFPKWNTQLFNRLQG